MRDCLLSNWEPRQTLISLNGFDRACCHSNKERSQYRVSSSMMFLSCGNRTLDKLLRIVVTRVWEGSLLSSENTGSTHNSPLASFATPWHSLLEKGASGATVNWKQGCQAGSVMSKTHQLAFWGARVRESADVECLGWFPLLLPDPCQPWNRNLK